MFKKNIIMHYKQIIIIFFLIYLFQSIEVMEKCLKKVEEEEN